MALKSKIIALVAAASFLGACGTVHPGAAAVINGQTISMEAADQAAQTFCMINLVGQDPSATFDNAEIRRQALTSLIIVEVAEQVATERGVEYTVPADEREELEMFREQLDPDAREGFDQILEDNLRFGAIAIALGRDANRDVSDESQLLELGMAELSGALTEMDVEIDPRFSINSMGEQIADSGSLSVASVNFNAPAPDERALATQCSGV